MKLVPDVMANNVSEFLVPNWEQTMLTKATKTSKSHMLWLGLKAKKAKFLSGWNNPAVIYQHQWKFPVVYIII